MNLLNRLKPTRLSKLLFVFIILSCLSFEVNAQEIQRVRLNFTAPNNSVRQILLAFTPDNSASDDYDFGWDAINWSQHANDINWIIGNYKCTVQAVGAFDEDKSYPLHLLLGETGDINISLHSLENFDQAINVFIYDSELDTFHSINATSFLENLEEGEYENRFYIAFKNNNMPQNALSNSEFETEAVSIKYANNTNELLVNSSPYNKIKQIETFSIDGKRLTNYSLNDTCSFKITLTNHIKKILIIRVTTYTGVTTRKIVL